MCCRCAARNRRRIAISAADFAAPALKQFVREETLPGGHVQRDDELLDGAPVALFRKVARVDRRHIAGPVRLGLDIAARQRPHLPRSGAQTGSFVEFADLAALEAAWREGPPATTCR